MKIDVFSPSALANACGCSKRTVLAAIKTGHLPACRLNGRVFRIASQDAARWLQNSRAMSQVGQVAQVLLDES